MTNGSDVRGIAFLRGPERLADLPANVRVVPLWPSAAFPPERLLVQRPEELLTAGDEATIEHDVTSAFDTWLRSVGSAADWRGVNLAECLRFDLRYALRDLLKTSAIIQKAVQAPSASVVISDADSTAGVFPAYPYLDAMLPLLRAHAERSGVPFRSLVPPRTAAKRETRRAAPAAYARLIGRQAMRQLEGGGTPVAVGPYPEFYAPLARVWKQRGATLVVATPTRSVIRPRVRDGYLVLPLEKTLTARDRTGIVAFGREVDARLQGTDVRALSGPDADILEPIFRAHVRARLAAVLPELAAMGLAFERSLQRASHILLVETVSPLGKATARFARKWKVPVTILQHGILGDVSSYGETEGDAVAAWGPTDADWFHAHLGLRAAPTGCPRYDGLSKTSRDHEAPASLQTIPAGRKVIMYATQPFVPGHALASPWTNADALAMALAAAGTTEGTILLVKWHPSQTPERLPAKGARPTVVEVHRGDTFACLRRADVLLVVSSTVALEGMMLDRPVVFLGPQDSLNEFDPPRSKAGLRALTAEDAAHHVGRLLQEPTFLDETLQGQRDFLSRRYAPVDGRAAERAVGFITAR